MLISYVIVEADCEQRYNSPNFMGHDNEVIISVQDISTNLSVRANYAPCFFNFTL